MKNKEYVIEAIGKLKIDLDILDKEAVKHLLDKLADDIERLL